MKATTVRFVRRIGKLRDIYQVELFVQRAWDFLGYPALPDLSYLLLVAKLRYIQSVYEVPECRNPDTLIHDLLSPPVRWLIWLEAKIRLSKLRGDPFYWYLIARTKYYDQVFTDAIGHNIGCIINIGCGTDTRPYRFAHELKSHGIKVIECDQAASIAIKQQLANRKWQTDHVTYVSVDLNDNDNGWTNLEHCLDVIPCPSLVMLEGVSTYINKSSFDEFLQFLIVKLHSGSIVAYDYKMRGLNDGNVFRLPAAKDDVIAYHGALGYRVQHLELSSDLSSRLLGDFATSHTCSFAEDGLLKLTIPDKDPEIEATVP